MFCQKITKPLKLVSNSGLMVLYTRAYIVACNCFMQVLTLHKRHCCMQLWFTCRSNMADVAEDSGGDDVALLGLSATARLNATKQRRRHSRNH